MSTKINLTRYRGDTKPESFTLTSGGSPVDITGWTFRWSVDTNRAPTKPSATNQFTVSGFVTNPTGGVFEFRPGASDVDIAGSMYHEVEATDSSGYTETVIVGNIKFVEDLA